MQRHVKKLAVKLDDESLAAALVAAGFYNPARIRAASNADLEAVEGIGPATRKVLRKKFPQRGSR